LLLEEFVCGFVDWSYRPQPQSLAFGIGDPQTFAELFCSRSAFVKREPLNVFKQVVRFFRWHPRRPNLDDRTHLLICAAWCQRDVGKQFPKITTTGIVIGQNLTPAVSKQLQQRPVTQSPNRFPFLGLQLRPPPFSEGTSGSSPNPRAARESFKRLLGKEAKFREQLGSLDLDCQPIAPIGDQFQIVHHC
jgi:hypothetical protein